LIPEILSETVSSAFAPGELDVEDFELKWVGNPLPSVNVKLEKNTIEWVRVMAVLTLPRARLSLHAEEVEGGEISNAGFSQPLTIQNGKGSVELPLALISGEKNSILIRIKRGEEVLSGEVQLVFKPRPQMSAPSKRIFIDSSCSPYRLTVESVKELTPSDWMNIGCRLVRVYGAEHRTSSLEVFVFWDSMGQTVKIGEVDTPTSSSSILPLRLSSDPGFVSLESQRHRLLLHYAIPKNLHNASLGLGVGPYSLQFQGNGEDEQKLVVIPTLYASYYITESIRFVGFGLLALESHHYLDVGTYIRLEQFRFLDNRLGINFLIGAHSIGFQSQDQYYFLASLPQGFELKYSDAFIKNHNLTLGAFLYPLISGRSYYNVWMRWGSQLFAEINYIAWQEEPNSVVFKSSSLGVTLGFPLVSFW
jgi:hypothetical protein